MGASARHGRLSDARSRLAACSHAARSLVRDLAACESGATSIEYALIASLLSIMILTGVTAVGTKLSTFFTGLSTNMK
jgi:pilus assembly protein Flp/PilA